MSPRALITTGPWARLLTPIPSTVRLLSHSQPARQFWEPFSKVPPPPFVRKQLPPESPQHILIPTPPQSTERQRIRVRGSLPPPRTIFRKYEGDRRARADYFNKTAPAPKQQQQQQANDDGLQSAFDRLEEASLKNAGSRGAFKRELTEARRQGLRRGLTELWDRRVRFKARMQDRSRQRAQRRDERLRNSKSDADRLTLPTVPRELLDSAVVEPPDRLEAHLRLLGRMRQRTHAKVEARRAAIVELYANARDFIVSENDLSARLDVEFRPDRWSSFDRKAESIWDVEGPPPGVQQMADHIRTHLLHDQDAANITKPNLVHKQTQDRLKKLAAELTGGKID